MKDKDVYRQWAPVNVKWVEWIKPVAFIGCEHHFLENRQWKVPSIDYLGSVSKDTAVILDLPEDEALLEGLAYTSLGCRPIPLYNGTHPPQGAMPLVEQKKILETLVWGGTQLSQMTLEVDANPVFLLDSRRLLRYKMSPSVFDNSWDIYDQDLPSAEYLKRYGINKIIVRSDKVNRDLAKILYKFQSKGLRILFTDGNDSPREIHIKKPPRKDKFH